MAYVQIASSNRRIAILGGVAALHAAALYALLSGLAVDVIKTVDTVLTARQIDADPPPPVPQPSAQPSADPLKQKFAAPDPLIDVNTSAEKATVIELYPTKPNVLPTTPAVDPLPIEPSPTPSFAPKAAFPFGNPGKWATSDDYPTRALREGREGLTRFRVTVGTDGRVINCEVTASSGSSDLDRATCENVAKRARFKPATDGNGDKVSGSYSNAVRWEIPN